MKWQLVSGMPAPQFGDESSWVRGSELVQGSSGSGVSFWLMKDVFEYPCWRPLIYSKGRQIKARGLDPARGSMFYQYILLHTGQSRCSTIWRTLHTHRDKWEIAVRGSTSRSTPLLLRGCSILSAGLSVINLTYLAKGKHSRQDEVNRFDTRSHHSAISLTIVSCLTERGSMPFVYHIYIYIYLLRFLRSEWNRRVSIISVRTFDTLTTKPHKKTQYSTKSPVRFFQTV
jgi:hypothetical protein